MNISLDKDGVCVSKFEDIMDCWVDPHPSKEATEKGWAGT
jgi:hypothetical protein